MSGRFALLLATVATVAVATKTTGAVGVRCINADNGTFKDSKGAACDAYWRSPDQCGLFDTSEFEARSACCACGGGNIMAPLLSPHDESRVFSARALSHTSPPPASNCYEESQAGWTDAGGYSCADWLGYHCTADEVDITSTTSGQLNIING